MRYDSTKGKRRFSNTDMGKLLRLPDKGVDSVAGVGGPLAQIWRQFLTKLNIDEGRWEFLKRKFVRNNASNPAESSLGTNSTRALSRSSITYASMIRGLTILEFTQVSITVTATRRNGDTVTASSTLDTGVDSIPVTLMDELSDEEETSNE